MYESLNEILSDDRYSVVESFELPGRSPTLAPIPESLDNHPVGAFLRQLVRAVLPLGRGTILDPFAGAGSTLAAAEAVGYESIGIEKDEHYFEMASDAIPKLTRFHPNGDHPSL